MHEQLSLISDIIRSRRSVFTSQFEPGAHVDDALIAEALENAIWAPNHGREEPWQFKVFTGKGLQRLGEMQAGLYKELALREDGKHAESSSDLSPQPSAFKQATYDKLLSNPLTASHVIAIMMKRSSKKNIPEIEDIEAVACAVQNLALSIHTAGLGGYWTTGGITYKEEAKQLFGLGEEDKLLGFFYIGKIAVPSAPAKRAPVEEKVEWIRS